MHVDNLVSEIDCSREMISRIINMECRKILFGIGKYLSDGNYNVDSIYEDLYSKYGNTIIFSKRSLLYSKLFYKKYHKIIYRIPSNITWNQIVMLLDKKYSLEEDIQIFKTINLFSLNEKEISYFLTNNSILFFSMDKDINNIVLEFMNLQERGE